MVIGKWKANGHMVIVSCYVAASQIKFDKFLLRAVYIVLNLVGFFVMWRVF